VKAGIASERGIHIAEVAKPAPGRGQILVKVHAAGLNRADLKASQGSGIATKDALGKPIGMEWAGIVVETGEGVEGFSPGDRVMCSGSGGYAEFAVSAAERSLPIPDQLGFEQAAVLPLALLTMHDAIATNGRLKQGEAVLVHGASSGVGLLGLQIARHLGAALVIGTSTDAGRRSKLQAFGADLAVDPTQPGWSDAILQATDGRGVDLIVDMVSGPAFEECMKAARVTGRIVNVGRLGGMRAEFDFDLHALRRLTYVGVTFRTRNAEEIAEIVRRMREDLWDGVSSGKLYLPEDSRFPLEKAAEAHARMQANRHFGKILLQI
jgi:NADPH:quinone reductase-like Zn-dependent oxidoreductase